MPELLNDYLAVIQTVMPAFYLSALIWIVSAWRLFQKAGQPGWAAIIPFYNIYVYVKLAGKNWVWVIYLLIPIFQLLALLLVDIAIAKRFGKGAGYGLLMFFIWVVFVPLLAFSDAQYQPRLAQDATQRLQ